MEIRTRQLFDDESAVGALGMALLSWPWRPRGEKRWHMARHQKLPRNLAERGLRSLPDTRDGAPMKGRRDENSRTRRSRYPEYLKCRHFKAKSHSTRQSPAQKPFRRGEERPQVAVAAARRSRTRRSTGSFRAISRSESFEAFGALIVRPR